MLEPSPGRVSTTLRSVTSCPSYSAPYCCSLTAPAGTASKRLETRSAAAESPALPGCRSGIFVAIKRAAADAVPPSNVPGGPAGSKGSGAPSSENITAMTATRAGAKARR